MLLPIVTPLPPRVTVSIFPFSKFLTSSGEFRLFPTNFAVDDMLSQVYMVFVISIMFRPIPNFRLHSNDK